MNKKSGKRLFFGCVTLIALMLCIGTGCPMDGGSGGGGSSITGGGTQSNPPPAFTQYVSADADGNVYNLAITETAARAAMNGDSYVLVITYTDDSVKTSTGTVTVSGLKVTLKPSNNSGTLTVTVTAVGGNMTGITGTIKFDNTPSAETITRNGLTAAQAVSLKDRTVYLSSGYPSYALSAYSGSGTVKLIVGDYDNNSESVGDIGTITGNKLNITFPAALDAKYLLSLADMNKVTVKNTADYTEQITGPTGTLTFSPADTKGALSSPRFTESGGNDFFFYYVEFMKQTRTGDSTNWTETAGSQMFVYSDRAATVKGTESYTLVRTYTASGDTSTDTVTSTWDCTLLPGWNRVYHASASSNASDGSGNYTYSSSEGFYTDKTKVDTSGWAWTINPVFEDLPYELSSDSKTLAFNIMIRGDGITADLPSDPDCDRWEHESGLTFPNPGKWESTNTSSPEYIEFLAGNVLKFRRWDGEIETGHYTVDTAGKKIKFQWDD
jgi:hypothetical protein